MIKQSLAFDGILEKKFKILRTSIMLGNLKNRDETLREYEDTAKEIDKIKKNVYEELLASKLYTAVTLEEEKSRLEDLIIFIEKRVKERNDFVDDYIKITSNFLDGLDKVSLEDEVENYKNRCNDINEYLNNCEEIKKLNIKLKKLRDELEDNYENKANNELINSKLEEELIDEFNKFISNNEYYSDLNYTDIDLELANLENSLVEKKGVLDTFTSSYKALLNAGITGAEREEYSSYVQDARMNFYDDIEKKCLLNIYKLILDKQVSYDKLFEKRTTMDSLLNERDRMRSFLEINTRDELKYFRSLFNEQFSIIKSQKFNVENIDKLIIEISDCENKLDILEKANSRSEIVDLLNEFSVESVEVEKVELPDEKQVYEAIEKTIPKKPSNMVVRIKDPIKINVKSVSDTAKLVMKKVVIVLEPKNANVKRDKLKEAELEIKKEKLENAHNKLSSNKEEILVEENINEENNVDLVDNDIVLEEQSDDKVEDVVNFEESKEVLFDNRIEEKNEIFEDVSDSLDNNLIFEDVNDNNNLDNNNLDNNLIFEKEFDVLNDMKVFEDVVMPEVNTNDIFLDDDLGINLDTKSVFGDSSVKDIKELTEIKINASDLNNMSIPTEIFIEDPPVEQSLDLFKSTDPFLDDNHFEIEESGPSDEIKVKMPSIFSIGSVKPNSALSKIEDVVKESENVTLPNLGLVEDDKNKVPIVSENYIS